MPGQDGRSTENEIAMAVLKYLAKTPKGYAEVATIIRNLTYTYPFTEADKKTSPSRDNEWVWEQQVRNITSHAGAEGNFITEGYLTHYDGGLEITDAGRALADAN